MLNDSLQLNRINDFIKDLNLQNDKLNLNKYKSYNLSLIDKEDEEMEDSTSTHSTSQDLTPTKHSLFQSPLLSDKIVNSPKDIMERRNRTISLTQHPNKGSPMIQPVVKANFIDKKQVNSFLETIRVKNNLHQTHFATSKPISENGIGSRNNLNNAFAKLLFSDPCQQVTINEAYPCEISTPSSELHTQQSNKQAGIKLPEQYKTQQVDEAQWIWQIIRTNKTRSCNSQGVFKESKGSSSECLASRKLTLE